MSIMRFNAEPSLPAYPVPGDGPDTIAMRIVALDILTL
jgi:hypothetical protein